MRIESLAGTKIKNLTLDHLLLQEDQFAVFSSSSSEASGEKGTSSLLGSGFGGSRSADTSTSEAKIDRRFLVEISPQSPQEVLSALKKTRNIPDIQIEYPSEVVPLPGELGVGSASIYSFEGVLLSEALEDFGTYRDALADLPLLISSVFVRLHARSLALGGCPAQRFYYESKSRRWRVAPGVSVRKDENGKEALRDLESAYELLVPLSDVTEISCDWNKSLPGLVVSEAVNRTEAIKEGPFFGVPAQDCEITAREDQYTIRLRSHREFPMGMLRGDPDSVRNYEHQIFHIADLNLVGSHLEEDGDDTWVVPLDTGDALIGFESNGDWVRLGRAIQFSRVPDVSNVTLRKEGESAIISWDWPGSLEVAEIHIFANDGGELFYHRVFDYQFQSYRGFRVQTSALETASRIQVFGVVPTGNGQWKRSAGLTKDCQIIF